MGGGSFTGCMYFVISIRSLNLQIVFVLCSLDSSSSLYIALYNMVLWFYECVSFISHSAYS